MPALPAPTMHVRPPVNGSLPRAPGDDEWIRCHEVASRREATAPAPPCTHIDVLLDVTVPPPCAPGVVTIPIELRWLVPIARPRLVVHVANRQSGADDDADDAGDDDENGECGDGFEGVRSGFLDDDAQRSARSRTMNSLSILSREHAWPAQDIYWRWMTPACVLRCASSLNITTTVTAFVNATATIPDDTARIISPVGTTAATTTTATTTTAAARVAGCWKQTAGDGRTLTLLDLRATVNVPLMKMNSRGDDALDRESAIQFGTALIDASPVKPVSSPALECAYLLFGGGGGRRGPPTRRGRVPSRLPRVERSAAPTVSAVASSGEAHAQTEVEALFDASQLGDAAVMRSVDGVAACGLLSASLRRIPVFTLPPIAWSVGPGIP